MTAATGPGRGRSAKAAAGALLLAAALLGVWEYRVRKEAVRPDQIVRAGSLASEAARLRAGGTESALAEAVERYRDAIALYRAAGERGGLIRGRLALGELRLERGEIEGALAEYQDALRIARAMGDPLQVSLAAARLGALQQRRGRIELARDLSQEALAAAERAGSDALRAEALFNLGTLQYSLGRMREALRLFESSAENAERANEPAMEARARLQMGVAATMMEERDRALSALEGAVTLSRRLGDSRGESQAVRVLGQLHSRLGESQKALASFDEARRLLQPLGDLASEATLLNAVGQVYFDLGEMETALRHYRQALGLNERLQFRTREAATLLEIGRCLLELDRPGEALEPFEKALAIYRDLSNPRLEADVLTQLGRLHERLADDETARRHFDRAVALKTELDPRGRAHTLREAASFHQRLGNRERALELLGEAGELSRIAADPLGEAVACFRVATLHRDAGRLEQARAEIERSLRIVESLRAKVASHALRSSFLATVHDHYAFYVDLLLRLDRMRPGQGFEAAAFQAAERARARTFLESLEEARASIRVGIDPSLLEEERELRKRLNEAGREQLLLDGDAAAEISREIDSLLGEYDRLQATIRAASPRYAALTQPEAVALEEVRSSILDGETRLLAYTLGSEKSFVWSVTREAHQVHELLPREEIESLAREAHRELGQPGDPASPRPGGSALARLSRVLLGPIEGLLDEPRLLVVPDGALGYVPFGALPIPAGSGAAPLVTALEVVRVPSASILPVLRRQRTGRSFARWAAVIADPVYQPDDPRLASAGSIAPPEGEAGLDLARLLSSRREALEIASLAPPDRVEVVMGFDANRERIAATDFRGFRVIHFATHGILDDRRPELSGIVLSLLDEEGNARDGFLRLHDIYNLSLPVDLVVLSACETGLGKEIRGEGLLGLVRGFMYAGASAVVASSWRVDDRATAVLMKRFYQSLFQGKNPASSLRDAQLAMLETERFRDPFYWSGFELQGDWR